jgi:hypothetical protein
VTELISQVAVIDFLPASYREQSAKRRTHVWRGLVIASFAMILATSGYFQYQMYEAAKQDLAAVEPAYVAAQLATKELAEAQLKLLSEEQQAELLTYLRHPWLRGQILTAIVEPLPLSLRLNTLNLSYQADQQQMKAAPAPSESQQTVDNTASAVKDLKKLRGEIDPAELVVIVTGEAAETAALHQYLAALGANELFADVELRSIEADTAKASRGAQFAVRLVVRPSYGQPLGPPPTAGIAKNAPTPVKPGA